MANHALTFALVTALSVIGVTAAQSSVAPSAMTLNVTPDFAVQGGDVIGFSFSDSTPGSFLYMFVGAQTGSLNLGPVSLLVTYPFRVVYGGMVNLDGVCSGGMTVPGSGPVAELSGVRLYLQGIAVKPVGGDVLWQVSGVDSVIFE